MSTRSYSGPLPPAEEVAGHAKVHPEAPGIIFSSFEKQGDHRRRMEIEEAADFRVLRRRSQWMALFLATIAIVTGGLCAYFGAPWTGAAIAVSTVLGVSAVSGLGMIRQRGR